MRPLPSLGEERADEDEKDRASIEGLVDDPHTDAQDRRAVAAPDLLATADETDRANMVTRAVWLRRDLDRHLSSNEEAQYLMSECSKDGKGDDRRCLLATSCLVVVFLEFSIVVDVISTEW